MSMWWTLRLIWLALGLLAGAIVFLPESAETLTGAVALIFILAVFVLLGRWAVMTISEKVKSALKSRDPNKITLVSQELLPGASLQFQATKVGSNQPSASESETEVSGFQFAGYQFKTLLNTEEEKLEPRKKALMWDSLLFAGGIIICAALSSLTS